MISKIEAKVAEIYGEAHAIPPGELHLFGGDAGVQLFNFLYLDKKGIAEDAGFQDNFQTLAENSLSYTYPTFCSGFAGINWFFTYLHRRNILTKDDIDLLCHRDAELQTISLHMLKEGNYDFLHGATGIAYYLLYSGGGSADYYAGFIGQLKSLISTSSKKDSIPYYDFMAAKVLPEETNLGLAHGIPAILKFCLQCIRQGICIKESGELARHIVDYLLTHTNEDRSESCFGYIRYCKGSATMASRLAWCYGDPGIAYILYQAGIILDDPGLAAFSVDVLLHSTKRKTLEEAGIADAGVCHGTAGVAHIYNKIWRYTSNPQFKEACDHWIQKTLDLAVHPDGIAGYKRFEPANNAYFKEYGMLEGAAGIGLVLLSYLTGDFAWDYCLLLND